jgi:hypothetical protein
MKYSSFISQLVPTSERWSLSDIAFILTAADTRVVMDALMFRLNREDKGAERLQTLWLMMEKSLECPIQSFTVTQKCTVCSWVAYSPVAGHHCTVGGKAIDV